MSAYLRNFARNLRRLRREKGLTQKEFALLLGYSEKTVSKWECETSIPSVETLFEIAKNLQTSIDDLFRENDTFYLGIDGGGTKTKLSLVDQEGKVIRSIEVNGCNPIDIGFESATIILKDAIYSICRDIPFSSVYLFAGIAGGTSAGMQERFRTFFEKFHFAAFANDSDNKNIVAAGLGKRDGITLIMGTGICAFVQKDRQYIKIAGWGYLIDNGGSGYNLGRDALNAYFSAIDGTGNKTRLTDEINVMHPGGVQEIMAYIYREGRSAVASFAPAVFAALKEDDAVAKEILERNIQEAVHIINTAANSFSVGKIPLILAGGLTNHPYVSERIKTLLQKTDRFDLKVLDCEPVNGAILLARELSKEEKG